MRPPALALAGVLLAGVVCADEPPTGRALLALCQSTRAAESGACLVFLQNTSAGFERAISEGRDEGWFCPPAEAEPKLFRAAFVEWAAENPDQLDAPATEAVRAAWRDAFPCGE